METYEGTPVSEDVLARIEAQREARRKAEREIPFLGETLVLRPSTEYATSMRLQVARIKVAMAMSAEMDANGDSTLHVAAVRADQVASAEQEAIAAAEEAILDCLDPVCHEAWARLRANDTEPLTGDELFDIADYLIGRVAGIPTSAPADSPAGRTKTARSSKGNSSSPATVPERSASPST